MPTIGQKLEETRVSRGLSIEDVAHRTRIHPNMLLRIEEDDFSQFPSVAYAKSFVRKYGQHLGLELGDAMETLDVGVTRIGENELMGEMKRTIHKDRLFRLERTPRLFRRRRPERRGSPFFLNVVLATLMTALGLFYFLGYNAPSAQKAKEEITRGIARGIGFELPPASQAPASPAEPELPPEADGSSLASVAPPVGAAAIPRTDEGQAPVYPPIKEAIELKFDDDLPAPPTDGNPTTTDRGNTAATLPRPRETPRLVLSENPVSPPGSTTTAGSATKAEPQPVLRPSGTNPPSPDPSPATKPAAPSPAKPDERASAAPASPQRAVPVSDAR